MLLEQYKGVPAEHSNGSNLAKSFKSVPKVTQTGSSLDSGDVDLGVRVRVFISRVAGAIASAAIIATSVILLILSVVFIIIISSSMLVVVRVIPVLFLFVLIGMCVIAFIEFPRRLADVSIIYSIVVLFILGIFSESISIVVASPVVGVVLFRVFQSLVI